MGWGGESVPGHLSYRPEGWNPAQDDSKAEFAAETGSPSYEEANADESAAAAPEADIPADDPAELLQAQIQKSSRGS